jgi:uncharacterized protein (TIGR03437 family)
VKQVFGTWCAMVALLLVGGASSLVSAQVVTATPEPFIVQLTHIPSADFQTLGGDLSSNGRFFVFYSNGDLSTQDRSIRNNADGNFEIFLIDYAQRRIFQITDTKNLQNPPVTPSPTPTPSPSPSPSPGASPVPTATPLPTPADPTLVRVEISNRVPMLSLEPRLIAGKRSYVIVFSSNAPTLPTYDPTSLSPADKDALAADANMEVWIYELPAVAEVTDLSSGADLPLTDLTAGAFTNITPNTTASRPTTPGGTGLFPFVADDNREASVSDDGNRVAFVSTRNLLHNGNTDGSPEIFLFDRNSAVLTQATTTADVFVNGRLVFSVFSSNPCLSSDGSKVAFISNANLTGDNNDDGNGRGNGEIYYGTYNGATVSGLKQITKTKTDATAATVVRFNPGRRLSRDGNFIAFESLATDPTNNGAIQPFYGLFVFDVVGTLAKEVGTRTTTFSDITRFPIFTDYDPALKPSTLIYASAVNFKADGTFPTTASDGLNPNNVTQIFATQVPVASSNTFTRLTNTPLGGLFGVTQPAAASTHRRLAFIQGGAEFGGGNQDSSAEVFFLLSPVDLVESTATISFSTGASNFPIPVASPTPTPNATPTPTPTPSPSPTPVASPTPATNAIGLAAGELGIIHASVPLALVSTATTGIVSETRRSPSLPAELNGVSVSVNGAAAGLYFVGNAEQQINFVVPLGLVGNGVAAVVINNNGTVIRGLLQIVTVQPDLFSTTNGAGGRAIVFNVTNPLVRTAEPFTITSDDGTGTQVPTVLEINLTGMRNDQSVADTTVTIGSIDIVGVNFVGPNLEMPGFDTIRVTLPATLAGAGDVPIIVTTGTGGSVLSSRPADTAPHITISP